MNQVKLNEKILITIKKIGINGEGVGYYKRQAIFVDGALPGEEVEVEIVDAKENYAYGEILRFKTKSPDRVEPKCPYYGKCGGCQLQHLSYEKTLEEKANIILDSFERYCDDSIDNVMSMVDFYLKDKNAHDYKYRIDMLLRCLRPL